MQQGHTHLTKENFLSGTEKEVNDNTHTPNRALFTSINAICSFQIFQKLQRLIARIARKLNQTLLQQEKYFFRIPGHQILTEVEQAT